MLFDNLVNPGWPGKTLAPFPLISQHERGPLISQTKSAQQLRAISPPQKTIRLPKPKLPS